jgi:hypothetical protein
MELGVKWNCGIGRQVSTFNKVGGVFRRRFGGLNIQHTAGSTGYLVPWKVEGLVFIKGGFQFLPVEVAR